MDLNPQTFFKSRALSKVLIPDITWGLVGPGVNLGSQHMSTFSASFSAGALQKCRVVGACWPTPMDVLKG